MSRDSRCAGGVPFYITLWGAVGRWCGACGWLQMRRIPSIMVSMGEVELGICQGKLSEDRGKNASGPRDDELTHN